jgi:predicted NBD/HSP70 family sugar kinase
MAPMSEQIGLGVVLRRESVRGLAVDIDGEVVPDSYRRENWDFDPGATYDVATVIQSVSGLVDDIMAGLPGRPALKGLGVAVGGHVDNRAGVVRLSPQLRWENVPFAELLGKAIGTDVVLHNDASALALAEQVFGAGRERATFTVVVCRKGIGCANILNNGLVLGNDGAASEFGHIPFTRPGRPCVCTRSGCLQTVASPTAAAEVMLGEGASARDLLRLAQDGDPAASGALTAAGDALGWGLSMLANVVNPGLVLLHGDMQVLGSDFYLPAVRASLDRHRYPTVECEVVVRHSSHRMTARGVASEVFGLPGA